MRIEKFIRDDGTLGPNDCLACKEEMNGLNYGVIHVGKLKIKKNDK